MQAFNKKQINLNSGGPKNEDMLFNSEELKNDFSELKIINIQEKREFLKEGYGHQGEAEVINLTAEK